MQDDPYVDVPDWLKQLQEPPSTEELLGDDRPAAREPIAEEPVDISQFIVEEEVEEETELRAVGGESLLDGLREQASDELAEMDRLDRQPPKGLAGIVVGLSPMQRVILSLLLFLDVTLLGCMCLVMTGRVVPFP
ncbi:MAG: hypothetical protein JXD18_05575 [Anaerolineae bacterium]|nr:hypothetical protein [Anaerolineae bacterium]